MSPYSTIDQLLEAYMTYRRTVKERRSDPVWQRRCQIALGPDVRQMPVCEFSRSDFERTVKRLRSCQAEENVMIFTRHMTKMFDYAIQCQIIYHNPCYPINAKRRMLYTEHIYTDEEMNRIIEVLTAMQDDSFALLVGIVICTGLRPGEVMGLTEDKIILDGHALKIEQYLVAGTKPGAVYIEKNLYHYGSPRTILLPEPAVDCLKRQMNIVETWKQQGWRSPLHAVFDDPTRRFLTFGHLSWRMKKFRETTGIPDITLSRIRQNYCYHVLERGLSQKALQIYAGYRQMNGLNRMYYGGVLLQPKNLKDCEDAFYAKVAGE